MKRKAYLKVANILCIDCGSFVKATGGKEHYTKECPKYNPLVVGK